MALLPVLVVLLIDYFRTFPERITCNTLPLSPGSKATHLTNNTTRGSRWRDIHFAKSNLKPMDEHGGGIIHRGAAQLQISSIGRPLAHSKSMKAISCPPVSQMILCIRVSKLVAVDVSNLHATQSLHCCPRTQFASAPILTLAPRTHSNSASE